MWRTSMRMRRSFATHGITLSAQQLSHYPDGRKAQMMKYLFCLCTRLLAQDNVWKSQFSQFTVHQYQVNTKVCSNLNLFLMDGLVFMNSCITEIVCTLGHSPPHIYTNTHTHFNKQCFNCYLVCTLINSSKQKYSNYRNNK